MPATGRYTCRRATTLWLQLEFPSTLYSQAAHSMTHDDFFFKTFTFKVKDTHTPNTRYCTLLPLQPVKALASTVSLTQPWHQVVNFRIQGPT